MFSSQKIRYRLSRASQPSAPARTHLTKEVCDVIMAAVLLVLTAPIVLVAALLVKLTSRGPAFYAQLRMGLDGRVFTIYKLRTMKHNCECLTGPQWSTPGDTRTTRVGRFLRAVHLDELPQLWNILRGEMSLVGPRPERPEFGCQLEQLLPYYRERLHVKPGLTGLAQVQLPADTDLVSVRNKLALDLQYVNSRTLGLDLRIIVATCFHVLGLSLGWCNWLCRLPTADLAKRAYCQRVVQAGKSAIRQVPEARSAAKSKPFQGSTWDLQLSSAS